jgi:hypothetical protein
LAVVTTAAVATGVATTWTATDVNVEAATEASVVAVDVAAVAGSVAVAGSKVRIL